VSGTEFDLSSSLDTPGYAVSLGAGGRLPSDAELAAQGQALDRLIAEAPPWSLLELVDRELLRRVPVGPTLLLGIGGSALGARAALELAEAGGLRPGPWRILDTVDPLVVADALDWASARKAKLMVVSKSGGTLEVVTLLEACLAQGLEIGALIGDPIETTGMTPLRERAQLANHGHVELDMPPEVGGRWSVFTAVGQAPLRAANLDPALLISPALQERERLVGEPEAREPLLRSLAWRLANPASCSLLWCYSEVLGTWAAWQQQLECESLGRTRADGSRVGEFLSALRGPADQHSVAQLLLEGPMAWAGVGQAAQAEIVVQARISVVDFDDRQDGSEFGSLTPLARLRIAERDACFESMTLPTRRVLIRDRSLASLAVLFLHGMIETALAAEALRVSPYGQPAVERIKRAIQARL
jgi:glucose-6-phosphate isomerase